jgi:RNA polymerase sigma-70 factor (ECF subfamily)
MVAVNLSFQEIYAELRPKILHYLTRLVGEFEAEDLTQEVFLKVSRSLETYRGEAQISTWVFRIATNAALDKLRSPGFRQDHQAGCFSLPEGGEPAGKLEKEIADQNLWTGEERPSLEQEIFRMQRLDCYQGYIESLPINYRTVVALSELGELAVSQIAEVLGLSVDTVKIRLHRGRARLLKELRLHCRPEDWL